jgi:AhpD family alkylhydroperoxidase
MKARLNAQEASPAAYRAMTNLEMFIRKESNLEPSLVELAKMRASQINGCAYKFPTAKFLTKGEPAMKARIDYTNVPEALRGMYQLEHYIHNSGLEESLVHLVKMRASQINGCAYCLDVHSKDARALGETEQRLYVLDAWEEAPFYSERERAALALTEAVTRITEGHVPDAVFERARAHFNEQELIALVFTLTTINAWNRLAITMRTEVGNYQPKARPVSQPAQN